MVRAGLALPGPPQHAEQRQCGVESAVTAARRSVRVRVIRACAVGRLDFGGDLNALLLLP